MNKKTTTILAIVLAVVLLVAVVAVLMLIDRDPTISDDGSSVNSSSTTEQQVPTTTEEPMLAYADYLAMTAEDQEAYRNSFDSQEDYLTWYFDAYEIWQEEQDKENVVIDGENPVVNAGDLLGGDD